MRWNTVGWGRQDIKRAERYEQINLKIQLQN